MADTIKKTTLPESAKRRVTVRLSRLPGQNAIQDELYSVNGRMCRVKRGETVEIREEIAEVIENAEKADAYAMNYVDELEKAEIDKKKEIGIH
jgi:hypothetical protein